jgi:CHASE1-domain containing sensor protein
MKRIVPILIIGIMVLSGLGAAAVTHTAHKEGDTE